MHDDRLQPLFDAIRAAVTDAYKRGREDVLTSMFRTLEQQTDPNGTAPEPANGRAKPEDVKTISRVPTNTIPPFVERVLGEKQGLTVAQIKAQARNTFERQITKSGIYNHLTRNKHLYRVEKRRWYRVTGAIAASQEL